MTINIGRKKVPKIISREEVGVFSCELMTNLLYFSENYLDPKVNLVLNMLLI